MKLDYLDKNNSIKDGFFPSQNVYVGNYLSATDYQLKQSTLEMDDNVGEPVFGGFYYKNQNGKLVQLNSLNVDGKNEEGDNANIDNVLNNLYSFVRWQGSVVNLYQRPLDKEIATEYQITEEKRNQLLFAPVPTWKYGIIGKKQQFVSLSAMINGNASNTAYVINTTINGGSGSITTNNPIVNGMPLTFLRNVDENGNIKIENILTEAQAGQVVIGKVNLVSDTRFITLQDDKLQGAVLVDYCKPYVL